MKSQRKKGDIVIVGLGLMGASLGKALQERFRLHTVVGLSRSLQKIRQAQKWGLIHWGGTEPKKCFATAELIVLATPVGQLARYLRLADRYAPQGCLVTDVGSTKAEIVTWAEAQNFRRIRFVGSHPLAGSHLSGMESFLPGLYQNAICFITLTARTNTEAVQYLNRFWTRLGCRTCLIAPESHDSLLAASSHFPHLLAAALVNHTYRCKREALNFIGNGYKDATRIAQGLPALWQDIIFSNRKNVLTESRYFIKELERVVNLLEKGDRRKLTAYFDKAAQVRSQLER